LMVVTVIVTILITVAPTPGFLGSYNAGILIALHEIMGESEIKAISLGMAGWVSYIIVTLIGGLYFTFREHMSVKTLMQAEKEGEATLKGTKHHQNFD